MPDGISIPGGPAFIGFPQPPDVPCDPTGDGWRGPPGPVGPAGIPGPPGTTTVVGGVPEAPTDGVVYGRQGSSTSWLGALPLTGGTISGPVTINGAITGTGIGWDIGDIPGPIVTQGGIAALHPTTELLFQRASFAANNGQDFHFRRATAFSGGTQSQINRTLMVDTGIGASDGTKNWGFLSKLATSDATGSANTVAGYLQCWRNAGSNAQCWGAVIELADFTGTRSSLNVGPLSSMEVDLGSSDVDDGANPSKWGGIGLRHMVHYVATRNQGSLTNEITHGLWFGTSNTFIDSILGADLGSGAAGAMTRQVIDTRGFIPPPSVTDPVASVRMLHDQIIDFNGGAALNSAPGAYLQYRTTTNRLYYVVAGVDQWSVDASGNVRARGTITGSTTP